MSLVKNNDKNELKLSKFQTDNIKSMIKYIIEKKNDLNVHDQYALFLELSETPLLKSEFFEYREKVLSSLRKKFDQDNMKMNYHLSVGMGDTHLKVFHALSEEFFYWKQRFDSERSKQYPNDYLLKMFAELMNDTAVLVSKFNMGTPIMVYFQRKMRYMESNNAKAISIKNFEQLNINKYNTDSSKQDSLNNDSNDRSAIIPSSISTDVTTGGQLGGKDGGSVRLSGADQGQHIQTGSPITIDKRRTEGVQGATTTTETEELF